MSRTVVLLVWMWLMIILCALGCEGRPPKAEDPYFKNCKEKYFGWVNGSQLVICKETKGKRYDE